MMPLHWSALLFYTFCLITLVQLFYYLWFFSRIAFFKNRQRSASRQHAVSVIVCARDEAGNLAKNLPGILVQSYPSTHEVIVINDNSYDESKYLLEGLQKTFRHLQVVELTQEAKLIPGKKFPLSIGIKQAKHEILLLTDADCVPASEHWITTMQNGYDDDTEIVLGYGPLHKKPGLLNKLIRFETFHTALQYLSYAQAGLPYMGVGRNLSYRRGLFFRHKGFSSHNHIPGGDDDLFINMAATKKNTRIVIDPDAFTLSAPARNWTQWLRQKRRHYSTGKYYKPLHKFLLGLYALTHFLFYPLLAASILYSDWRLALGVFGIKFIVQQIIYYKAMRKLNETDLWAWIPLLDLWMCFYYLIFAPALWRKPRTSWK
jgi:glycosyltransferase involved in cell wall biosynthesis